MNQKKSVLIIFGGKSGEHEVSVKSATSIENNLDRELFSSHCLGITQDGKWHYGETIAEITSGGKVLPPNQQVLLPSENEGTTLSLRTHTGLEKLQFDLIFPIIHGTNGEDGTLQGLLELSNLPYVGSGVLGSAVAMDKVIQKMLCAEAGIPQTDFMWLKKSDWDKNAPQLLENIDKKLVYPLFVKPANLGSSVGITKVKAATEIKEAIEEAFKFDHKVIVEQAVTGIQEIEVSVLGNDLPVASVCGSIQPQTEFYDYQTKYVTDDIEQKIPAEIPAEISEKIRAVAVQTFSLLNCAGLARVDFFFQSATQQFFLNEINTLPGFTTISMYPKLWEKSGLSYGELLAKLLELAEERWEEKQQLQYQYE